MPYFTTNDMTPEKVHDIGKKQLEKLYPMVRKVIYVIYLMLFYVIVKYTPRSVVHYSV